MSRRLHIGGKEQADGWEILNKSNGPEVDHNCDAIDLSRFDDNSFSEIYASHILEHFDYMNDVSTALAEWNRVLCVGGKISVSVPDLDLLAAMFLDSKNFSTNDKFEIMRMIFGGHVDSYDFHLTGFNLEILTTFMGAAGFTNISKVENFGLFNDTSNYEFKGHPISLNITASK